MIGWFLDIWVVYVVRALLRIWKRRGTSRWERRQAQIASITFEPALWGCDVVEIVYIYKVENETYSATESVPFIWEGSAKDYTRRYPEKSMLAILVKPGDPEMSMISNWN